MSRGILFSCLVLKTNCTGKDKSSRVPTYVWYGQDVRQNEYWPQVRHVP